MKKLILLLFLSGCTPIAHIGKDGGIVVDRPDLYSATAQGHERGHQRGLYHCWNLNCKMFFVDLGSIVLCSKCEAKLRPTSMSWMGF